MEKNGFRRLLWQSAALYCMGSALVAQAQDTQLPFTPTMVLGNGTTSNLINDQVTANSDGSYNLIGNQRGGTFGGGQVWELDWNLTVKQDPFIIGSFTLTNLTTTTRDFNLLFSLPVSPTFAQSRYGGSISATLIDFNNNLTARLAPNGSNPASIYRGQIGTSTVLQLFSLDVQNTCSSGGCSVINEESFGMPGATLPGPGVNSTIAMRINFALSAGDRVSFLTNFTVEPVPLPAALPLLLAGLAPLSLLRRRRRANRA